MSLDSAYAIELKYLYCVIHHCNIKLPRIMLFLGDTFYFFPHYLYYIVGYCRITVFATNLNLFEPQFTLILTLSNSEHVPKHQLKHARLREYKKRLFSFLLDK